MGLPLCTPPLPLSAHPRRHLAHLSPKQLSPAQQLRTLLSSAPLSVSDWPTIFVVAHRRRPHQVSNLSTGGRRGLRQCLRCLGDHRLSDYAEIGAQHEFRIHLLVYLKYLYVNYLMDKDTYLHD